MFNTAMEDIEQTFNTPMPVPYGGTGADNAADARISLGLPYTTTPVAQAGVSSTEVMNPFTTRDAINYGLVPLSTFNNGPTADISTSYRTDAAFVFTARGPVVFLVASYHADNTVALINDLYIRVEIIDNTNSLVVVSAFGQQSCPAAILSAAAQPSCSIIYGTLTKGRSYTVNVATRKGIAAGPITANNIRCDGLQLGI